MKLVIVGGVAGGATAAARARRLSEDAEITLIERGPYISYANCGLPYFISGDISERSELLLQTPESFNERYGVRVRINTEVVRIDRVAKRVHLRDGDGEEAIPYDALILAQGGQPVMPAIPGMDEPHVFKLWTVADMDRISATLARGDVRSAVVVGGGFIGLEMAEAFRKRGLETTVVELQDWVMPHMDPEFGEQVARELAAKGVRVLTEVGVEAILPGAARLSDGRRLDADIVLFAVGVRPELALARQAGLEIGESGGLVVNDHLQTSDPAIHAAGDMLEVTHRVSGRRVRIPLAGPANRQGRIAASNAMGMSMRYCGAFGTSVVKIFDATAAITGLSERAARQAGLDVGVAVIHKAHHASYYPGASELMLKIVYDRSTGRLLGGQAFGHAGIDKRIDVLATALQGEMTLEQLAQLDLAYAPPYSSANDPVNLAAFVGMNDLSGYSPLISAGELGERLARGEDLLVLDVRTDKEYAKSHLREAVPIPLDSLRRRLDEVPRDRPIVVYCRSGFRSHVASRILRGNGFQDVLNLTGGFLSLQLEKALGLEATDVAPGVCRS